MKKVNYKDECLKINPKIRASKVNGCAFYHIIEGFGGAYRAFSSYQDTISLAWKDCYIEFMFKHKKLTPDTVSDIIHNYPTKHRKGFTNDEMKRLIEGFKINKSKFNEALGVNTGMVIDGDCITYHTDIESALNSLLRGGKSNFLYWD